MRNSLIPIASHLPMGVGVTVSFGAPSSSRPSSTSTASACSVTRPLSSGITPTVMGILAITSMLMLVGNIVSDICVALVDPRVRFGVSMNLNR